MQPWETMYRIWSGLERAPEVALERAQQASFLDLKSPRVSTEINGGIKLASITDWIWFAFPAVIFEIVQQASFLIPSFGEESRLPREAKTPEEITTWVWASSPVTILPTDRSAGVWTENDGWLSINEYFYLNNSTNRRTTPASITAWIFSLDPSER